MTAFITPCYARIRERWLCVLRRGLWTVCLVLFMHPVWADAEIRYAAVVAGDDGYVLNADFDLDLGPRLSDAIARGVALHFTLELLIEQPRRFWFDKSVVERRLDYRLSYNAITRSHRLQLGSLHRNYDSLESALATLTRIRNLHVADADALTPGQSYNASLRLRHDKSMLPRPFQVSTIGSPDWNLSTPWMRWTFLAGASR